MTKKDPLSKLWLLNILDTFENKKFPLRCIYEGWNFNSGNYLFTTDTK